jgi:hypothetical protein
VPPILSGRGWTVGFALAFSVMLKLACPAYATLGYMDPYCANLARVRHGFGLLMQNVAAVCIS